MEILLTNDDGIYAPGLAAMEHELKKLGNVTVVAPATEQSGVGHSVTFLSPLVCKEIFQGEHRRGWAVEGSPADCVKIGVFEFCQPRPDLIVSGINGGLNAGINVLYSGTVAAAIEGAFFGITSVAVSLEYDPHAQFETAADKARQIIEQLLKQKEEKSQLFNINMPTAAMTEETDVVVVPMGLARYGEHFIKRVDPRGRDYYWATGDPPPEPTDHETDLSAMKKGLITVTPLQFDMTQKAEFEEMKSWDLRLSD
ncbi:MAG: 5'/3'-nucleotidase SurE [Blastopirellula sp.]|nr:MAG: 5'/3'-nucleotidase SurE [Blastopirellula sp.]